MRSYPHLKIAAGVRATAATASGTTTIPDDSAGVKAKMVSVRALTASETAVVLPVTSASATVTASTGIPVSKEQPLILDVSGFSHIAHIRFAAADVAVNITPVENY